MEASRYELVITKWGYMAYDHDCNQFLYNKHSECIFETALDANKLIEDAVFTNIEHEEDRA